MQLRTHGTRARMIPARRALAAPVRIDTNAPTCRRERKHRIDWPKVATQIELALDWMPRAPTDGVHGRYRLYERLALGSARPRARRGRSKAETPHRSTDDRSREIRALAADGADERLDAAAHPRDEVHVRSQLDEKLARRFRRPRRCPLVFLGRSKPSHASTGGGRRKTRARARRALAADGSDERLDAAAHSRDDVHGRLDERSPLRSRSTEEVPAHVPQVAQPPSTGMITAEISARARRALAAERPSTSTRGTRLADRGRVRWPRNDLSTKPRGAHGWQRVVATQRIGCMRVPLRREPGAWARHGDARPRIPGARRIAVIQIRGGSVPGRPSRAPRALRLWCRTRSSGSRD